MITTTNKDEKQAETGVSTVTSEGGIMTDVAIIRGRITMTGDGGVE